MRRLGCLLGFFILLAVLLAVGTGLRASLAQEDPLACLADRGDGALAYDLDSRGRWRYAGALAQPPVLLGVHGAWNGYDQGNTWSAMYGWPNDLFPYRYAVLLRGHTEVGQLWFYISPTHPDLRVLFVFRTMHTGADGGAHDFCWWGTLR